MSQPPALVEGSRDYINAEYINIVRPSHPTDLLDRTPNYLSAIRICDDLLDQTTLESLQFDIDEFEDNYRDGAYIGSDIDENDSTYGQLISALTTACNRVLAELNYPTIKSVHTRVLLTSDVTSPLSQSRHTDDTGPYTHGFTMSYHWLGAKDCGGTQFFTNYQSKEPVFKIPFKPNRLAIFPSCIPHEGYAIEGYPNKSKRVVFTLFTILEDNPSIFTF